MPHMLIGVLMRNTRTGMELRVKVVLEVVTFNLIKKHHMKSGANSCP